MLALHVTTALTHMVPAQKTVRTSLLAPSSVGTAIPATTNMVVHILTFGAQYVISPQTTFRVSMDFIKSNYTILDRMANSEIRAIAWLRPAKVQSNTPGDY